MPTPFDYTQYLATGSIVLGASYDTDTITPTSEFQTVFQMMYSPGFEADLQFVDCAATMQIAQTAGQPSNAQSNITFSGEGTNDFRVNAGTVEGSFQDFTVNVRIENDEGGYRSVCEGAFVYSNSIGEDMRDFINTEIVNPQIFDSAGWSTAEVLTLFDEGVPSNESGSPQEDNELMFYFPIPVNLTRIGIQSGSSYYALNTDRVWVYGSHDGVEWVSLLDQVVPAWSADETKYYTWSNTVKYHYYKLDFSRQTGQSYIYINKIRLYVAQADNDTFTAQLSTGGTRHGPFPCGTYSKKVCSTRLGVTYSLAFYDLEMSFNTNSGHNELDEWDAEITFNPMDVQWQLQAQPQNQGQPWENIVSGEIALNPYVGSFISDTDQTVKVYTSGENYVPFLTRMQVKSSNYSGEIDVKLGNTSAYIRGVGIL